MNNIHDLDNKLISDRIGKMLKSARIKSNLTQKELSQKSGVSLMTISGFESGRASVSLLTLIQLLRSLEMLEILDLTFFQISSSDAKKRVRPMAIQNPPPSGEQSLLRICEYTEEAKKILKNKQNITIEDIINLKKIEESIKISNIDSDETRNLQKNANREIAYWMNKNIDLEPYLISAGYNKKHGTQRWRRFEKENNAFLITDANTIWNTKTGKNINLFQFIIENYPKNKNTISNTKHMIDTVLENEGLKTFVKKNTKNIQMPIVAQQKEFSITQFRLQPLNINQNFLLTRHISVQTLKDPLFFGTIIQGNKIKINSRYNNVIYPFKSHPSHTNDKMLTLMQQYGKKIEHEGKKVDKIFAHGNGKSKSLWFSNILPNFAEKEEGALYIFENPLDALSHYQINKTKNALYCATGGNPAKRQNALIYELCEKLNAKPVLCFDKDMAGCRFDACFLASIKPEKLSVTKNGENLFQIKISNLNGAEIKTTKNFMATKNIQIIQKNIDITAVIDNIEKAIDFNVFINKFILNKNIKIEKSNEKDYNDDLKKLSKK